MKKTPCGNPCHGTVQLTKRNAAMKARASSVAHAEPRTPSAGNPKCPKISTQFATALTTFAAKRVVPVFALAAPPLHDRFREAIFATSLPAR